MAINYDLNNTGPEVQERLDQVMPNKTDISQEVLDRQAGDNALQEQITAINNEIGESGQGGETINGRLDTLEAAVGDGGSVDERIAASAAELVGTATEDYDTLGKVEGVIEQNKADQQAVNDDTYRKSETYSKEEVDNIAATSPQANVNVMATPETTSPTDVLPAQGDAHTLYRVGNWNGSEYDPDVYTEYAWNGTQYVQLAVRSGSLEQDFFNVSEYTGDTYAGVSNAANAVPLIYRKPGLVITYKDTDTGNWLSFQHISTDITNWSTASNWSLPLAAQTDEEPTKGSENLVKSGGVAKWGEENYGFYKDGLEFIHVITDVDGKIIGGIKQDGSVDWYKGVPLPIKREFYKIQEALDNKVDGVYYRNPEYVKLITDDEGKILWGIKKDGTTVVGNGLKVLNESSQDDGEGVTETESLSVNKKINLGEAAFYQSDNPEFVQITIDKEGKILFGIKRDGTIVDYSSNKESSSFSKDVFEALSPNKSYEDGGMALPMSSCNCMVQFSTNESIFKNSYPSVISIPGVISISIAPSSPNNTYPWAHNTFLDTSAIDVVATYGNNSRSMKLINANIYGKDLFSIRIKYPVVTDISINGVATISNYMPSNLEGAYLEKTELALTIHNGDGSVLRTYIFANYSNWDELLAEMIAETTNGEVLEDFEVIKYGCEGDGFDSVNNFEKVYLSKEIREVDYHQRAQNQTAGGTISSFDPMPSGTGSSIPSEPEEFRTYWDSYPTFIRTSDIGFTHIVRLNYHVKDNVVEDLHFSFDGYAYNFTEDIAIPLSGLKLIVNESKVSVTNVSISPYKEIFTPIIMMLHDITPNNEPPSDFNNNTYERIYDLLAYLRLKGFVNIGLYETLNCIDGGRALDRRAFCFYFDDHRQAIWNNEKIRNLMHYYNVYPFLNLLANIEDYLEDEPPCTPPHDFMLSKEEYAMAKSSGWEMAPHSITAYGDYLTYAQFKYAFELVKTKWRQWYGEDPRFLGWHMRQIQPHQYMTARHMGYGVFQGTHNVDGKNAILEAGGNVGNYMTYPRMGVRSTYPDDGGNTWEYLKGLINNYCLDRPDSGMSNR